MKIIHQVHPEDFARYTTAQIREKFLLENLVTPDKIECVYTHYDRMIIGAANPVNTKLELGTYEQLKSCLLYTSPSPRDRQKSRMPSSA